MKFSIYLSLIFSLFFVACESDDSDDFNAHIDLKPLFGQTDFNLETTYQNQDEIDMVFTNFKFYMNHIELIREDGSTHEIKDVVLMDFSDASSLTFSGNLKPGTYKGMKFGLGLDKEYNKKEPSDYGTNHPLSSSQNMHWGWAMLYKFSLLEGKFDSTNDDITNQNFAYHPGLDTLYREIELSFTNRTIDEGNAHLDLSLDVQEIIDGNASLDLMNENFSHSSPENLFIVRKIVNNFAQAFKVD